jgi:hypothetical protein
LAIGHQPKHGSFSTASFSIPLITGPFSVRTIMDIRFILDEVDFPVDSLDLEL